MAKVPQVLHDMLVEDWGGELTERIEAGYRGQRPVSMRVNTLKSTREEIVGELDAAGIAWHEVRWYPDALVLENVREETVMQLPMYTEGRIYLQSLSAMIPPLVLKTKPGDSVLDMAAAPGGKATQICALAGGRVTVTACERDHVRAQRLAYNLRLQGAKSATVMEGDARNLNDLFRFDAVLLDAPCTGSGTLQLDVETEETVLRNIIRFHPNKAIIISTHRPGALKLCQRIYRIHDGGIEEVAPAEAASLIPHFLDNASATASLQHRAAEQEAYLRKQSMQTLPAATELPEAENENGWWGL